MAQTKKALLVGCNYPGQQGNELKGCCNDARRMCTLLKTRFGFPGENIDVLVDDTPPSDMPTHANIRKYLNKLVGGAQSGDTLVFFFAGHGGLLGKSSDNTGWNEAIFPNDMTNPMTDDDIRIIVNQVPAGVNFTLISDSCSSGGLIDEMKEQVGDAEGGQNNHRQFLNSIGVTGTKRMTLDKLIVALNATERLKFTVDESNYISAIFELHQENASVSVTACQHGQPKPQCCKSDDVGVLLSGCESWETSSDNPGDDETPPYGEFTKAIEKVVSSASKSPSNKEIVDAVRALIQSNWDQTAPHISEETGEPEEGPQHPTLYCSDANVDKVFICDFVKPAQ